MEVLVDSYQFTLKLILAIESGLGIRPFIRDYLGSENSQWNEVLSEIFLQFEVEGSGYKNIKSLNNPYEKILVNLVLKALDGNPVLDELKSLEKEYFLLMIFKLKGI